MMRVGVENLLSVSSGARAGGNVTKGFPKGIGKGVAEGRRNAPMKHPSLTLCLALAVFGNAPASTHAQSITLDSQIPVLNGAEIIAYTPSGDTVATNVTGLAPTIGVQLFTLEADGSLTPRQFVSIATEFGGAIASVSSVALDPLERGFGVMTVTPTANGTTEGVAVFFDYLNGAVLSTVEVGFHPDNVIFSRDGSKVFVANEGEFTSGGDTDAPGSVSVIDLTGITNAGGASGLDNTDVTTVDFTAGNLAAGVDLDDLRYNDDTFTAGNAHRHVEPEYITEGEGKIYVTLQENNGIAEFSLTGPNANRFTAIFPLGLIEQTIDASDRDGPGGTAVALIDDVVKGMPMPDTLTSFLSGGVRYLVTANEGDFRGDDADRIRVKDFSGTEAGVTIDRSDAALGRLRVLLDMADPDGDTLLDEVIMPGTRSFSVWNASTGALVADTGSFEPLLLSLDPTLHNNNGEDQDLGEFDSRSDDKGPEPEAITTGVINGNRYIFVGMERQGGILMYNADNPAAPAFVAYINNFAEGSEGLVAPESIVFIPAADSPTGANTLLIGYEVGGNIGVYTVEGEPADPVTITVKNKKITVGPGTKTVQVRGTASANTVSVTVNGKTARGTTSWKAKVKFPKNKKTLKVKVVATSDTGASKTQTLKLVRRR